MKINSILVFLNYSHASGALRLAANLAHKTGAELKALYVEDRDWFEVSSFSFSRQISGFRGEILPLTEDHASQQSQALAARFKKVFDTYSQSLKIKTSYSTVLGSIKNELLKAAEGMDLVILPGNARAIDFWHKYGKTLREISEWESIPLLIWNNGSTLPGKVIGVCISQNQSSEVIDWSLAFGETFNCKTRLFWEKELELNKMLEKEKTDKLTSKRIKAISEIKPVLSADLLHHYRNVLFVIHRKDLETGLDEILQNHLSSVLLL